MQTYKILGIVHCKMSLLLKALSMNQKLDWELIRNAEPQAPAQTYWIRICILPNSSGDLHAHSGHEAIQ